ncbi:MAG: indolepyruvate oxidoreductase subunit beta [Caldisericaceae bacterium]
MKPYSIYIAGVGGQGVVKTSLVIGAACVKKGVNIVMSEIHGMSQRGGSVPAEIKIGNAQNPVIEKGGTDLLISFEPAEAIRAIEKCSARTIAIVNTNPIIPFTVSLGISKYLDVNTYLEELRSKLRKVIAFDGESIAKEAGNAITLNMVMLGASAAVPGFPVEKEYLIEAMKENLPEKAIAMNIEAFNKGFELSKLELSK